LRNAIAVVAGFFPRNRFALLKLFLPPPVWSSVLPAQNQRLYDGGMHLAGRMRSR
jgi:hypothetical protein